MKNLKRYILMIMVSLMFFSFSGCLPEDTTGDKEAVEAEDNQNNSRGQNIEKSDGDNTDNEMEDDGEVDVPRENDEEEEMNLEECFGLQKGNEKRDEIIINNTKLVILKGDITKLQVDAIVNAANERLQGGGGVDGAIGRVAGRKIYDECKAILDERKIAALPTGEAVITSAGEMKDVKRIIHTPGPRWYGGDKGEAQLLKNSYVNSLNLAKENDCKTVAFPSISTGIFGYPLEQAANIAISETVDMIKSGEYSPDMVIFILFDEKDLPVYQSIFRQYKN
ncbi:MAG: macro domain-containing protein [Spirochaetales bacterium]|nr:macro domain-containing protein [Spirochaetales bacterium]